MTDERQEASPSRAVRFLVRYEGGDISVIDQQEFEMAVPPSDALKGFEGESGFSGRAPRWQQPGPLPADPREPDPAGGRGVRGGRHGRSRCRRKPTGVFTSLVPDLPGADHVALVSSPLEPEQGAAKPAELLTSIPMRRKG